LDHKFGKLKIYENEDHKNLLGLDLRSNIEHALSYFQDKGLNLTILVHEDLIPNDQLQVLKQFIPYKAEIIPYGNDIDKTIFMISKVTTTPEQTIFVASDRTIRTAASTKGYIVLPHLSIASIIIKGNSISFVKITGDEILFDGIIDVIPYYLERYHKNQIMLLGIASYEAIVQATVQRLKIDILNFDFSIDDAMFIFLDRIDYTTKSKLMNEKIIFSDGKMILLSLSSSKLNDSIPFHDKHGHFLFLSPDPTLLEQVSPPSNALMAAEFSFKRWPLKKAKLVPIKGEGNLLELSSVENPVDETSIQSYVDRYSGMSELDETGKIVSRHCEHLDSIRAINAIKNDLRSLGYQPMIDTFSYINNKNLINVIADLPGEGYFKSVPDISEQIRKVFLKYPFIHPEEEWIDQIANIVGNDWLKEQNLEGTNPLDLRKKLEEIFLKDSTWWSNESSLTGLGSQMIIVCCHLDSTGKSSETITNPYIPSSDPAPGADDNASGMAGVLALSKYLSQFRGKFRHTIRFCFFNAEEVGRLGSFDYATYLKEKGTQIKAVINLDMIGYNTDQNRIFEIHAGFPDPVVRDLCVPLAELVKRWSDNLGKVGPAQIYKGTRQGNENDYDRDLFDGAIKRSDHYSFQIHGYPSIHISEDFFANLPIEPDKDNNPEYHKFTDTKIDSSYVSNIVNALGFAIKELASK
jgi:hypothetical protein